MSKLVITVLVLAAILWAAAREQDRPLAHFIEDNCVAVLAEAHTEKNPAIGWSGNTPETDGQGNYIVHIPERTLKLRCKQRGQ